MWQSYTAHWSKRREEKKKRKEEKGVPEVDWDFSEEEDQEQHVEEDEDHAIAQQAQDNANVEDEEPLDVLHGRICLGFEIRFNDWKGENESTLILFQHLCVYAAEDSKRINKLSI